MTKKQNFIDALEKAIIAIENLKAGDDALINEDIDTIEQDNVFDTLVYKLESKKALLEGKTRYSTGFGIQDHFPDFQLNSDGEVEQNKFFSYTSIMGLEFITASEVKEIMGFDDTDEVYRRLEELPAPIYKSDMLTLWNKKDFEGYQYRMIDQVITVSEAAEILKVSERHVRRLCEAKKISARKNKDGTWLIGLNGAKEYVKGLDD